MRKLHKNQSGFGAVEVLLAILIVAVVGFGGYYVWHTQQNSNSTTSTDTTAKSAANTSTKTSTSTSDKTATAKYLTIKEFGIKIPLTSTTAELGYVYKTDGYGAPYAELGSKTLAQEASKNNPKYCTQAYFDQSNGLYPISYIYSAQWNFGDAAKSSVVVNGKTYYWYVLHSGAGCDTTGTTSDYSTYRNIVLNSFSETVAQ